MLLDMIERLEALTKCSHSPDWYSRMKKREMAGLIYSTLYDAFWRFSIVFTFSSLSKFSTSPSLMHLASYLKMISSFSTFPIVCCALCKVTKRAYLCVCHEKVYVNSPGAFVKYCAYMYFFFISTIYCPCKFLNYERKVTVR